MAPSLLEYARHHGLATNHLALDLTLSAHPDSTAISNALDLPHCSSSLVPHPHPLPPPLFREPKLRLRKSDLDFLAAGLRTPPLGNWDEVLPARHRIRDLKLETPLLAADHEADQRRSVGGWSSLDLDLEAHGLVVPELCDGVQSKRADTEISTREKLPVTKRDLLNLKHILRDSYTSEAYQQLLADALPGRPCTSMFRSLYLEEDEMELEEDRALKDLEKQNPNPPIPLQGPTFANIPSNVCPVFSATQSLLSFMGTRGDKKLASSNGHHFAAVQTGEGICDGRH